MAPTDRSKSSNHWCITISNTRMIRNLMARYFVGIFGHLSIICVSLYRHIQNDRDWKSYVDTFATYPCLSILLWRIFLSHSHSYFEIKKPEVGDIGCLGVQCHIEIEENDDEP
jgi:hypothetical protein